jgi:hypothetical protein
MRKVLMLAVMLIAPALLPERAEAGDRGHGFRHAPSHFGAGRHFSHPGKWLHGRSFSQHRHFWPRHFGHSAGRVVLQFHSGGHGFKFGHRPFFKPHHVFRHRAPVLTFGHQQFLKPWGFSHHQRIWRGRSHHRW